jgi:hypothetical protein
MSDVLSLVAGVVAVCVVIENLPVVLVVVAGMAAVSIISADKKE